MFIPYLPHLAEAQKAEKQALINMGHLISSTCEVLALLQLLCYHQFHAVTATLTQVCQIVLVSSFRLLFYPAAPAPLTPFSIFNFDKSGVLTWSVALCRSGVALTFAHIRKGLFFANIGHAIFTCLSPHCLVRYSSLCFPLLHNAVYLYHAAYLWRS